MSCHTPGSRRDVLLAAAASALAAGCTATRALDLLVPSDSYRLQPGLPYGALPRQQLDAYLPATRQEGAPMAVFFYGGNWSSGRRQDYRFVGEALASAGIVTLVADYRLSPEVGWRDILRDCAAAVRLALSSATRLEADPRRVFLMGHSAGAYNAAMLALDGRWLAGEGLEPRRLAGWIGVAGPYDFLPIGDPLTRTAFGWPDTPADSQPVAHAGRPAPPALLLAAREDSVVDPVRSSEGLARRLRAAGTPVRVRVYDRVSHATVIGALAPPLRGLAPMRDEVVAFVRGEAPPD